MYVYEREERGVKRVEREGGREKEERREGGEWRVERGGRDVVVLKVRKKEEKEKGVPLLFK